MKYILTMFLLAGMLAGCSAASSFENAPQGNHAGVNATGDVTEATEPGDATSMSKPDVVKVRPPMIPIGPDQGTPMFPVPQTTPLAGWQTYTSTAMGVAVDHPKDWLVTEDDEGVGFTSPQGLTIRLQEQKSDPDAATTGQDCATLTNSYGQTGDICFDAATFAYRAVFMKPADAPTAWLTLSVTSQEKPTVFFQMFDSLHFAA